MEVRGVRKGFIEHMLFELGLEKGVNSLNEDIIVTCVHIKNCQEEGEAIHLWKPSGRPVSRRTIYNVICRALPPGTASFLSDPISSVFLI